MTIASPLRGTPRRTRTLALFGVSLLALGSAEAARAGGPQGGTVVRGTAEIARSAARTTIRQSSQRAVIDWRRFDVGRDHTVTFAQPGRDAATLNRVITAEPSLIEGAIRAPGTVIIQNGAGVVFSGTSRVDTGGLVATSQAVDAERFQRDGGLTIGGGERAGARVVNEGRITVGGAGLAALVGGDVENAGAIVAERGTVALAGGTRTTLDLTGDGLLRIAVDGDGKVTNRGTLDVGGGRVVLTAGAAAGTLDAAINTSGVIRARSGSGKGGTIELTGQRRRQRPHLRPPRRRRPQRRRRDHRHRIAHRHRTRRPDLRHRPRTAAPSGSAATARAPAPCAAPTRSRSPPAPPSPPTAPPAEAARSCSGRTG